MVERVLEVSRRGTKAQPVALRLPVMKSSDSAASALTWTGEGRSGVVTIRGGVSRLYRAASVVVTLAENPKAKLADVPAIELTPAEPEAVSFKLARRRLPLRPSSAAAEASHAPQWPRAGRRGVEGDVRGRPRASFNR